MDNREGLVAEARRLLDELGMLVMWYERGDPESDSDDGTPDIVDCERFERWMRRLREVLEQIGAPFEELFPSETTPDGFQRVWSELCGKH